MEMIGSRQVRMPMYISGVQFIREGTIANGGVAINARIDLFITSPLLLNTCLPHFSVIFKPSLSLYFNEPNLKNKNRVCCWESGELPSP